MKPIFLLCLVFSAFTLGCARHVVVEPEELTKQNNSDWSIKSAPVKNEQQK